MQNKQFLKTGQVAKILNVIHESIKLWIKKGILISHHTDSNDYNFFPEKQLADLCKNKASLLTDSKNGGTSSNIRKQTAAKLQKTFVNIFIILLPLNSSMSPCLMMVLSIYYIIWSKNRNLNVSDALLVSEKSASRRPASFLVAFFFLLFQRLHLFKFDYVISIMFSAFVSDIWV